MRLRSTSSVSLMFLVCTFRVWRRPARLGLSTMIRRSNRPARSSALSRISGRLVAARITTPLEESKPSISESSWFRVCSRSSLLPSRLSRLLPMASISSMKIMAGACLDACWNRSRTRLAPTPTNISTKSEPEMKKNGTPASPATAFARRVLPVPGEPTSSAPLGIFAPMAAYFWGLWRKSMISCRDSLASS